MANSNEIGSRHKRQHQVLRVPQGLQTSYGQLYTTKKRNRVLNTMRIPPTLPISRESSPESGLKSGPKSGSESEPGPSSTTAVSTNDDSAPATPWGNPRDLERIHRGGGGGGESSSARKAHLRSIRSAKMGEIQAVSKLPWLDTTITFSNSDLEGCQHPHDDPLVIHAIVANTTVHRVLIDNGSSADIIFASAFDKMGIGREKLEPVSTHLRGFSGEKVLPLGLIQLVLTLGEPPCQETTTARFLIVDAPSAYNMLLGRPSLNAVKAIPSA